MALSQFDQDLPKREANHVPLSPISLLPGAALRFPTHPAIVQNERVLTWAETFARCRAFADALRRRGIQRNDTVSIIAPNTLPMAEAHFGVPMAGAVLHAINTRLDPEAIAFQLRHGNSRLLFVDREFAPVVARALAMLDPAAHPQLVDLADPEVTGIEPISPIEYEAFLAEGDPAAAFDLPPDEWDAITLNYTSGTTGDPKGVVAHHRGAYINALNNAFIADMRRHMVYLWCVPMFHCNGWCHPWTVAAVAGTNICLRRVDPKRMFDLIRRHKVTNTSGAPIIFTMLTDAPDEWRAGITHRVTATTGGAPPPSRTFTRAAEIGFDLVHIYGLTETYGPAAVCPTQTAWAEMEPALRAQMIARQGKSTLAMEEMSVRDPETLEPVPADGETIGEIMFRGNIVMKGYLKNPAATEACFKGGFFRTGDLAVLEPDGYIRIRDRSKDVIISGGENISSVEVEEVICRHPAVIAAAVVARPDPKWGEAPAAFVELREGQAVSEAELLGFCRQHLAGYKMPKSVQFGPLPRTSTGKVQKYVLRDTARALYGEVAFVS